VITVRIKGQYTLVLNAKMHFIVVKNANRTIGFITIIGFIVQKEGLVYQIVILVFPPG
jgi:hypothetical protein